MVLFPQDALSIIARGWGDIICVEKLKDGSFELQMHTRVNGDCLFFDRETYYCDIYLNRPCTCQIFPYGGSDEPEDDSESRDEWIMKNCPLYTHYGKMSSLGIKIMKFNAETQRLESDLTTRVPELVKGLIEDREERLEEEWDFIQTENYSLTYWARKFAPVQKIIKWVETEFINKNKSTAISLYFYNSRKNAICALQGIFKNKSINNPKALPQTHEELLEHLDDYYNDEDNSNHNLLEGWEPWPPKKKK